jgi:hypothetical protein
VLGQVAEIEIPVCGGFFDHVFHPLPVFKKNGVAF